MTVIVTMMRIYNDGDGNGNVDSGGDQGSKKFISVISELHPN